jgi:hypothetical protein
MFHGQMYFVEPQTNADLYAEDTLLTECSPGRLDGYGFAILWPWWIFESCLELVLDTIDIDTTANRAIYTCQDHVSTDSRYRANGATSISEVVLHHAGVVYILVIGYRLV